VPNLQFSNARASQYRNPGRGKAHKTCLEYISLLVLLVMVLVGIFKARLILVRIGRHEALDGDENRLEALSRGPLLSPFASPSPIPPKMSFPKQPVWEVRSYPRIDLSELA
jgi:hypothetical protein